MWKRFDDATEQIDKRTVTVIQKSKHLATKEDLANLKFAPLKWLTLLSTIHATGALVATPIWRR